jgi:hypothetical protein
MSKRLNKRQQREQEELDLLKAEQKRAAAEDVPVKEDAVELEESEEDDEDEESAPAPLNAFAAVSLRPVS